MNSGFAIRVIVAVFLVAALGAACGGDAAVGCRDSEVRSGPAGDLTVVTPCNITASPKVDLDNGERVQVDATGQAVVEIKDCGLIYVFQDSGLQRSACAESLVPSGSAYCALSGTSAMNNQCSNVLQLATPTSVVLVDGTYFSVSYDPETQVSLIASFEDDVEIFPLTRVDGQILDPTVIEAGQFYVTAPDDRLGQLSEVTGIEPRAATDLGVLPRVVDRLGFGPAYGDLVDQLRMDGIDPGVFFGEESPMLSITATGGALGERAMQEALMVGVDWSPRIAPFLEQGLEVSLIFDNREPVAADSLGWDLRAGRELVQSVVDAGHPVMLLVAEDDAAGMELAQLLLEANRGAEFGEGGIEGLLLRPELVIASDLGEASELFEEFVGGGTAVIWLGVG
ncbi:MAG: hypothetical protein GY722_25770 [bacterium]|nr:hypothetical protein [bacterium]